MYSPKIREELVRAMYWIKCRTGVPITRQANEAIAEYLTKLGQLGEPQATRKKSVALRDGSATE